MTEGNYVRNLSGPGPLCAGRRSGSVVLTGLLYVAQLWLSISNFARNSPAISSNFEFMSLELQRFRVVSKNDRGKLRAKFVWAWSAVCRAAVWLCGPDGFAVCSPVVAVNQQFRT